MNGALSTKESGDLCIVNEDDLVRINVSGVFYETHLATLERFPDTLLGNKERRQKHFSKINDFYYFPCNPHCFDVILYYYQNGGVMVRPDTVPMPLFVSDLVFFGMSEDVISSLQEKEGYILRDIPLPKRWWQKKIWLLFEVPDSSKEARLVAIWSILVITVSIVTFCLETMPQFQHQILSQVTKEAISANKSAVTVEDLRHAQPWITLELSCLVWFTIEYLARLISSPNKWTFFRSFLNLVDLFSILPYIVTLAASSGHMLPMLRIVRLARVFRVFKFSRHSQGLQILGHTLRASVRVLVMLVFFLCLSAVLFSSAIFYAEREDNPEIFKSIPETFWYSIVTMTTIGYGDKVPTTFVGKIVGGMCAISGVLAIALPVPVVVANFEHFYKRDRLNNNNSSNNNNNNSSNNISSSNDISDNNTTGDNSVDNQEC